MLKMVLIMKMALPIMGLVNGIKSLTKAFINQAMVGHKIKLINVVELLY